MHIQNSAAGLDALRARIAQARAELPDLLQEALQEVGTFVVGELSAGAPRSGQGSTAAPADDGSGPLAESFYWQSESPPSEASARITVHTTQGTKLRYVTEGTGIYGPSGNRIVPVNKQALFWPDAQHPVRSVAGQKPNDFVTPVLDSLPDAEEVFAPVLSELTTILEGA